MKFFNSDKSGFLSFVAKRMKALFALLFIIAGVQTLSAAALVKGDWDGWQTHDLILVADNEYYVDIEMTNAATDEFGIEFNGIFYSLSNYTITNWCSLQKFYTNNSNCKFTHNEGTYRFRVRDDGNAKTLTITGIIVTIDQPVQNADGTYTITGHYTNANPDQQRVDYRQIVFTEGVGHGVGANETATFGENGSFSITKQLVEGQQYTCCARAIDGSIGNHDSEYITFTAEAATPEPEPTVTDLYLRGDQMGWGAQSSDEWKQTSVSSDGNVYTWDWTSAPKTIRGNFKIAALPADGGWDNSNNFGPKGNDVTLPFENGVATVTVWSDGGSKNINTTEQVSKIEFDKAALTVTFYTTEQPTPVFGATITATPGTEQIDLTSILTESVAGTDLTSATCQFQYKAADAGDETYADMSEPASVKYSGEGATRTATLSQSMAAGSYVFRAVWTYDNAQVLNVVTEMVSIGEPEQSPIKPTKDSYVVEWAEPVYDSAARTVTVSATVSTAENAGFTLADATFEAQVNVEGMASSTRTMLNQDNNSISHTIQGVQAGSTVNYSLQIVTGGGSEIVLPSDVKNINPQAYVVEEQGPTDLNLYVRGQNYNEWGYPGEDFKGITEDGIIYTWDWTESPKKMSGPFKIAYCNIENPGNWNNDLNFGLENVATLTFGADGTWTGTLVKNESGDMTIDPARNVKKITFKYDTKELLIETETSSSCQDLADGFTISGQFNAEILDADGLYKGSPVVSGEADPADGYWSDGARYIQLTANSVTANYFEWECTGYAIDGVAQGSVSEISWTDKDKTSARAELSLPGTYTLVCKAKCNEADEWTNSAELTITAPVPAMGFDGPIGTPASVSENGWNHAWAGQSGNGLLVRENASLKWSLTFVYQGVGSTPNDFVVIQRYKRGCVTAPDGGELGWAGFTECGAIVPGEPDFWGNKINASVIDLASGLGYTSTTEGDNFRADDLATEHGWVAGVTELTLTVTMTGWDSYTVELTKKQEQIYANYSSNDVNKGTVAMKVGDTPIGNGVDITAYIGQQVTLTASPAQGYKVASWKINGKVTESDRTTISPTLSGEGLNVVVTFERDCYSGVVYDLNGGGIICADGGSTELSLNTLNNVTYQLYKNGAPYDKAVPVQGNGAAAKWTISEAGTYTAKAYDSRFAECQSQAIDMNGRAVVKTVTAPEITVNPGDNVHLTVLQARSFTAKVPVEWSIRSLPADTGGDYCKGDGYMISSQTDTSLVAKFLCVGTAKITATMKAPNQNCMAEVTVTQNAAETEACAPEPEDMQ